MAPFFYVGSGQNSQGALFRLCRARDLLREIRNRPVSVREAASEAALSPYHFIRRYRAVFGETPHQTLIGARLDKAKELLIVSELSVTEICLAVGFSSLGTFSYAFSRLVGSSPSVYRRQFRSMVQVTGVLPQQLRPGCFSLMCGWPEDAQFSRSAPAPMAPDCGTAL